MLPIKQLTNAMLQKLSSEPDNRYKITNSQPSLDAAIAAPFSPQAATGTCYSYINVVHPHSAYFRAILILYFHLFLVLPSSFFPLGFSTTTL
jgi:hypothetical protein